MKRQDKSFPDEICDILDRKGYSQTCYPVSHLARSIEDNDRYAKNKVLFYKWLASVLLLFIPLISTYVSIVVAMKDGSMLKDSLPYVTGVLTVMTVVNSIYRPRTRFTKACVLRMNIDHLKNNFLAGLEKLPKVDSESLLALELELRTKLEPYQEQLIAMFLPESGSEDLKPQRVK